MRRGGFSFVCKSNKQEKKGKRGEEGKSALGVSGSSPQTAETALVITATCLFNGAEQRHNESHSAAGVCANGKKGRMAFSQKERGTVGGDTGSQSALCSCCVVDGGGKGEACLSCAKRQ